MTEITDAQFVEHAKKLVAQVGGRLGQRVERLQLLAERNQLREERDALLARIKSQEWEIAKSRAWFFGTRKHAREAEEIRQYWEDLAKEARARCAAEPATGWMCSRCWKVNAPHASQCTCHVGPSAARKAKINRAREMLHTKSVGQVLAWCVEGDMSKSDIDAVFHDSVHNYTTPEAFRRNDDDSSRR